MKKEAFTLLEILIVVVIIGVLATVAVPQYSKILQTRKAAEAEGMLTAVRNEQEARCTLSRNYQGNLKDIGAFQQGKNFEYSQKVGVEKKVVGIIAQAKGGEYTLEIPSYADGRICCRKGDCEKLGNNYPMCTELEGKADYVKPNAECGVEPVMSSTSSSPCPPDDKHKEGEPEVSEEGKCTVTRTYKWNSVVCDWDVKSETQTCKCDESEHKDGDKKEETCDCGTKKITTWKCNTATWEMESSESGDCIDKSAEKAACTGANRVWNDAADVCKCECAADIQNKHEAGVPTTKTENEKCVNVTWTFKDYPDCEWESTEEEVECKCAGDEEEAHEPGDKTTDIDSEGCERETTWIKFEGYPVCAWEKEYRVLSCPCVEGELRDIEGTCQCGQVQREVCKADGTWEPTTAGTCGLTQEEKADCRCSPEPDDEQPCPAGQTGTQTRTVTCQEGEWIVSGWEGLCCENIREAITDYDLCGEDNSNCDDTCDGNENRRYVCPQFVMEEKNCIDKYVPNVLPTGGSGCNFDFTGAQGNWCTRDSDCVSQWVGSSYQNYPWKCVCDGTRYRCVADLGSGGVQTYEGMGPDTGPATGGTLHSAYFGTFQQITMPVIERVRCCPN